MKRGMLFVMGFASLRRRPCGFFLLSFLVGALLRAFAATVVHLHFTHVQGNGWQVHDATVKMLWHGPRQVEVQLSVTSLNLPLPPPLDQLQGLEATCAAVAITPNAIHCERGTIRLRTPILDQQPTWVSFHYQRDSGTLRFALRDARFAGSRIDMEGRSDLTDWHLTLNATALDIAQLPQHLVPLLEESGFFPTEFTGSGRLQMSAHLSGRKARVYAAELSGTLQEFAFSDVAARWVGQQLTMTFALTATRGQEHWPFRAALAIRHGHLYFDPVFLAVPEQPLSLVLTGSWVPATRHLDLASVRFVHPHTLQGEAWLQLVAQAPLYLLSAQVQTASTSLSNLYHTYLHPFLIGTALDALHAEGQVSCSLNYTRDGTVAVHATIENTSLEDERGRYALSGVTGTLRWTNAATISASSSLNWQGGHVYRLPLGAGTVTVEAYGTNIRLLQPTTLPVLDGTLHIDRLHATHLGTPQVRGEFAGRLTAVSMEALSQALGWPTLSGHLSGDIPLVTYTAETVRVDGSLHLHVFDGQVAVHNLRLAQPFGLVPHLFADVDLHNLDLARITRTFSFGAIHGRLGGHIHGLHLQAWQPVAFDAFLATPADDTSTRTISQKAVESLSSLGGISGALSRSILRVFDTFSYDRLGLSCRLRRGVCEMGGLEPANGGYYIVKGGGVPRIDVVGYEHRVDWRELIARLKRATQSPGPVLQ